MTAETQNPFDITVETLKKFLIIPLMKYLYWTQSSV